MTRLARPVSLVCLAGIVAVTLALRLFGLSSAHDIFVDEATYARLGASVASGQFVPILFGHDFYLQPPAFFWMLGLVEKISGPMPDLVALVLHLRFVNVAFAGVSAALLFMIGRRLGGARTGTAVGVLAGLMFALDPFLIEYDGLVMIETSAAMLALVGWCILLNTIDDEGRVPIFGAVASGLAFGLALLTKETTFFLIAPALIFAVVANRLVERRQAILTLAVSAAVYLTTFVFLVAAGNWSDFVDQKFQALERLFGTLKITGFKAPGAPSFVSKIVDNLPHYGSTYLLMGLGALAVAYIVWRGTAARRLFGLAIAGEMLATAFDLTFGGLVEQQHFYLFVAPATVAIALVASDAFRVDRRAAFRGAAVCLAAVVLLDGAHFIVNRTAVDTGYQELDAYLKANYAAQPTVLSTTDTWELLSSNPFKLEGGKTLRQQAFDADSSLVLTSTKQINEGYTSVGMSIYGELRAAGARVIWSYVDRSNGTLELWLLPPP